MPRQVYGRLLHGAHRSTAARSTTSTTTRLRRRRGGGGGGGGGGGDANVDDQGQFVARQNVPQAGTRNPSETFAMMPRAYVHASSHRNPVVGDGASTVTRSTPPRRRRIRARTDPTRPRASPLLGLDPRVHSPEYYPIVSRTSRRVHPCPPPRDSRPFGACPAGSLRRIRSRGRIRRSTASARISPLPGNCFHPDGPPTRDVQGSDGTPPPRNCAPS